MSSDVKKTILLVEDDDLKARSVIRIIERAGLTCQRCATVIAAFRAMNESADFIALITDWGLPMRDDSMVVPNGGARVVQHAGAVWPSTIPIYVYSGHDDRQQIPGVRQWLRAPDDSFMLMEIIEKLGH